MLNGSKMLINFVELGIKINAINSVLSVDVS